MEKRGEMKSVKYTMRSIKYSNTSFTSGGQTQMN